MNPFKKSHYHAGGARFVLCAAIVSITACGGGAFQIKQRMSAKPTIAVVYNPGIFKKRSYKSRKIESTSEKIPPEFELAILPIVAQSLKEGFELSEVSVPEPKTVKKTILGRTIEAPDMSSVQSDLLVIVSVFGEYYERDQDDYEMTVSAHLLFRENQSHETLGSVFGYSAGEVRKTGARSELPAAKTLIGEMEAAVRIETAKTIQEIQSAQE